MAFSITTYNVGLLDIQLLGFKVFEFAKYTRVRAAALGEVLRDHVADIICIQELYHSRDIEWILDCSNKSYPFSTVFRSRRAWQLSPGLMILSRHPICEFDQKIYTAQSIDERIFAPKGFQSCLLKIPTFGHFRIVNTHLTAGGLFRHPESREADMLRLQQVREIVREWSPKLLSEKIVLCGDLNCGPTISSANFEEFLDAGFTYGPDKAKGQRCESLLHTWDPQNELNRNSPHKTSPAQRIDHILVSEDVFKVANICIENTLVFDSRSVNVERISVTVSDHYGISAQFFPCAG